jgi:ferredoxin--NADP+ reductase
MYTITYQENLASGIHLFEVEAEDIAKKAKPGQFIILRIDDKGERIPLTIADWDEKTVTIVFMEVGKTTQKLATLSAGDSIADFVGPLGQPTEIESFGRVVVVGGGVGIPLVFPIARELKRKGNTVISIIGSRNKDLLFWEDKMRSVSDEIIVTTDDGSYGRKALVTQPLQEILEREKVQRVFAVGPVIMMKFCAATTKPFGVKTIVSLNPIMVDGTGMCGCCRVEVGGETKFACVDGPDFDAHLVDFDLLMMRQKAYLDEEKKALEMWERPCPKS